MVEAAGIETPAGATRAVSFQALTPSEAGVQMECAVS